VIPATVLPPSEPLELALSNSRALLKASRLECANILTRARKRAARYREKAKELGYRAGLERGTAESSARCAEALESLSALYARTVDAAQRDVALVAYRIVEELIEQHLREDPVLIARWISRAMDHLKTHRGMTLRYHPRYHETLGLIATHIPSGITISMDPNIKESDFAIDTTVGTVTFSWRELLRPLKPTTPDEGAP
jgi:flagellar biosynthesis/type III secretory pathway protein FliH